MISSMIYSPLVMYTIYDHPKDYPNHFVVRIWVSENGKVTTPACWCRVSLLEARNSIPDGKHQLPRDQADDPVIVETWI